MNKRLLGIITGMSKEELIALRHELGQTIQRLNALGYRQATKFVYTATSREIDLWEQGLETAARRRDEPLPF